MDKTDNLNDWTLTRFIGLKESKIKGKVSGYTEKFESGISCEELINQMNSENCFDFDYNPTDKDCLIVSTNENNTYKYFRIIYLNGQWQLGGNPVFRSIVEKIGNGKIKIK